MTAIRMLLVFTVLTGIVYPYLITGIGAVAFPEQASGSPVDGNMKNGCSLLAPKTTDSTLFMARPSAGDYATVASGASNLGPSSKVLHAAVLSRDSAFRALNGLAAGQTVPPDMLYASGSGLDPHISVASARLQVARVARMRNVSANAVNKLVDQNTQGPEMGFLGGPLVNVVLLNYALQRK